MKLLLENWQKYLTEAGRHHVNKYDPGSLLAQVVSILEREGLMDAALSVRGVSRTVSEAWMNKDLPPEEQEVKVVINETLT